MEIKLHLGCGKRYIPGFIHIDLADYPHIDYKEILRIYQSSQSSLSTLSIVLMPYNISIGRKLYKEY
jgi:predicted SAM-dependent methyltransferase